MMPDEAKAIYDQTCAELAERFNWVTPIRDRSRADFAVARNLVMLGFERADVIAVLLNGSVKAGEMNRDRASSWSIGRWIGRSGSWLSPEPCPARTSKPRDWCVQVTYPHRIVRMRPHSSIQMPGEAARSHTRSWLFTGGRSKL